jgi:hypothetical protein
MPRPELVRPCEGEHAGDVGPEGVDRLEQHRLLRFGAGRGRKRPLGGSGFGEVPADPIECRLVASQRIGLDGVRHVAHQDGQRRQIVLNPKQLQRILAVAFADGRLLVPEAPHFRDGVGAHRGDGDQRKGHPHAEDDHGRASAGARRNEIRHLCSLSISRLRKWKRDG